MSLTERALQLVKLFAPPAQSGLVQPFQDSDLVPVVLRPFAQAMEVGIVGSAQHCLPGLETRPVGPREAGREVCEVFDGQRPGIHRGSARCHDPARLLDGSRGNLAVVSCRAIVRLLQRCDRPLADGLIAVRGQGVGGCMETPVLDLERFAHQGAGQPQQATHLLGSRTQGMQAVLQR